MKDRRPHEPTAPLKPVTRGRGDTAPPAPPHELEREREAERRFTHDGRTWIARLGGKSAYGTGSYGLAMVEAIHFFDAAEPDRPLREALLAHGAFDALFDAELVRLLETSRPIEIRNP
ncbi:MAG TPA: hypothetical protein VFZ24_14255 [Longimicrobiales bacterium]